MHIETASTTQTKAIPTNTASSRMLAVLLVAVLGSILVFAAGFAGADVLHNATHDSRHSTGFPCH
ncbi:MAG: CbtB-domain containing protein [Gammaproteobacteria bacterium]|nr:CbtB-domain containing protein [Gammaproteobacteria bacterium]